MTVSYSLVRRDRQPDAVSRRSYFNCVPSGASPIPSTQSEKPVAFILLIMAIAGAVWGALAFKFLMRQKINPVQVLAALFIVASSVFGPDFLSIDAAIPLTIDRMMLVGTIGLFVLMIFLGFESVRPFNRMDLLVFGLLGFMAYSTFTNDWRMAEKLPVTRLLFFNMLPVAAYFVVRNSRLGTRELRFISITLGLLGGYLALTGVAEMLRLSSLIFPSYIANPAFEEFYGRARGPFLNPVSNGIY